MRSIAKNEHTILGFVVGLTIVFVVLKLFGEIDWSWLWVLSPVWGLAIVVAVLVFSINVVDAISWGRH